MRLSFKTAIPPVALVCFIAIIVLTSKHDLLTTRITYNEKERRFFLSVTNESSQEIMYDAYDQINNKLDWHLCAGETVVVEKVKRDVNLLLIADHYPMPIRAHAGYRFDLAEDYPELSNSLTNANIDCFIWHEYFWDKLSLKWIQKTGQIRLRKPD